jgi:hypothetical protein
LVIRILIPGYLLDGDNRSITGEHSRYAAPVIGLKSQETPAAGLLEHQWRYLDPALGLSVIPSQGINRQGAISIGHHRNSVGHYCCRSAPIGFCPSSGKISACETSVALAACKMRSSP